MQVQIATTTMHHQYQSSCSLVVDSLIHQSQKQLLYKKNMMITASFVPASNIIGSFGSLSSSPPSSCSLLPTSTIIITSTSTSTTTTTLISSTSNGIDTTMFLLPDNPISSPLFIAIIAIILLIAAQSFINQMLEGDQGLGAFLKDGSGYNRSGYRPAANTRSNNRDNNNNDNDNDNNDPLPWLKLPRLDFVEVAGQQKQSLLVGEEVEVEEDDEPQKVYEELERLKLKLNIELEKNSNINSNSNSSNEEEDYLLEATRLRKKIERLMKIYGIKYETE
jgi:hypothetical protein